MYSCMCGTGKVWRKFMFFHAVCCYREEVACYPCSQYTTVKHSLVTDDNFPSAWLTGHFSFLLDTFPCATAEGKTGIRLMSCSSWAEELVSAHMLLLHFPVVWLGTWSLPVGIGRVWKNPIFISLVLFISSWKNRNIIVLNTQNKPISSPSMKLLLIIY